MSDPSRLAWDSVYLTDPPAAGLAVWGDIDNHAVRSVSSCLASANAHLGADCPLPDTQWAMVVQRMDGSIIATASTMLQSGLFWSVDRTAGGVRLAIGASLADVVRARQQGTGLDEAYIRGFAFQQPAPERTPYREVRRIRPGVTAQWSCPEHEPLLTEWSGPDAWPLTPLAEGPEVGTRYLATFDSVVSELTSSAGPIAAFLSGGLDSSFVVAALARHASAERPVHAFSHAPHPDARPRVPRNWDADDSQFALAMQRTYPERVIVHRVVNEDLVAPLDAALHAARRSWVPAVNPCNQVWLTQIENLAAQMGASALFSGENGNPAFSYEPTDAAAHYLRRADLRALIALIPRSRAHDVSRAGALLSRFAGTALAAIASASGRKQPMHEMLGLPAGESAAYSLGRHDRFGRREYLEWLAGSDNSYPACLSPGALALPLLDPFQSASVMELAASMTPREWCTGPFPRGFARRLGQGRVPDEIRLRTRRGGQAMDTWFVVRGLRDRYFDEIRQLDNTPVLGGWLDTHAIQRTVASWPWQQVHGPSELEVFEVDRLLSLAAFVRMTQERLRGLPQTP